MATAAACGAQPIQSILIVDDDARVTRAMARNFGVTRQVSVAHDRSTAIELARRSSPDLMIVDLRLGPACGIETIRYLKTEAPNALVALVSGYVSIDIAVLAVKAGADYVMAKPITGSELLRRLGEGVREESWTGTPSLAQVEAEHIARVLIDCEGNVSEAARRLGIYRSSLQRKLRKSDPRS